jgi:hypothetical protein
MAVETETFTAADSTHITSVGSSIWSMTEGDASRLIIDSNALRTNSAQNWLTVARRAGTFTDNQYAQCVLRNLNAANSTSFASPRVGVAVRNGSASSGTFYILLVWSDWFLLSKRISFSSTDLRSASGTFTNGDSLRLEVEGTTLRCLKNGSQFYTTTDAGISSGNPGIASSTNSNGSAASMDDWEGGDLVTAALQNFQYDWPHQLHARR